MDDVFENDKDPKPLKEKKIRKKRVVSEETKKRLRAQLAKGRATALANRNAKKAKNKKIKSESKVIDTVKEEPPIKEPEIKETPKPAKKEVIAVQSPPKPKEEPMIVNSQPTPKPEPRIEKPIIISQPIDIPPPLEYQSTFKKMRRKW
mgnify:CR=1 FL=1|tara:strand:+ start:762 stop:1205 length:444 start_codon:yes stop_codon:yes gene_type:complete